MVCIDVINKKSSWLVSFSVLWPWGNGHMEFFKKHVITWLTSYWKIRWVPFTITHHPTYFDGLWRCETGDTPFCKYNVITWKMSHVIQWLWSTQNKSQLAKTGDQCVAYMEIKLFKKIIWSQYHWVTSFDGGDILILNYKSNTKSNRTQ